MKELTHNEQQLVSGGENNFVIVFTGPVYFINNEGTWSGTEYGYSHTEVRLGDDTAYFNYNELYDNMMVDQVDFYC